MTDWDDALDSVMKKVERDRLLRNGMAAGAMGSAVFRAWRESLTPEEEALLSEAIDEIGQRVLDTLAQLRDVFAEWGRQIGEALLPAIEALARAAKRPHYDPDPPRLYWRRGDGVGKRRCCYQRYCSMRIRE